jgi:uncharacterized protein (TIGR03437 family)
VIDSLLTFIRSAHSLNRSGVLTRSQTATLVTEAAIGIQVFLGRAESVNAAGFAAGSVAPNSIATVFGDELGTVVALAPPQPLLATLAGVTLTLIDSEGTERPAPLFLVSPGQVNYLVPPLTAPGRATVIIAANGHTTGIAPVDIDPISPGLFTADAAGTAAALVQRVKADGTQSWEPATGAIDLGPETDQLFLVLFGTGLRGRSGLSAVTARIGGRSAEVIFAGAQGAFDGLDQVNVRLARSLAGVGRVEIGLTLDGWEANTVTVTIQ